MNLPPELAHLLPRAQSFDLAHYPPTQAVYALVVLPPEVLPRLYRVRSRHAERLEWGLEAAFWEGLNRRLHEAGRAEVSLEQALLLLEFLRYCRTLGFRVMPWLGPVAEMVREWPGVLTWRGGVFSWEVRTCEASV